MYHSGRRRGSFVRLALLSTLGSVGGCGDQILVARELSLEVPAADAGADAGAKPTRRIGPPSPGRGKFTFGRKPWPPTHHANDNKFEPHPASDVRKHD